jgi:site-specific recombinase XerD
MSYLERLPNAVKEVTGKDGQPERRCIYSPHSLRATTATLLLDAGTDMAEVQELLGHRHITTTQIYDKRRRGTSQSASHKLVI